MAISYNTGTTKTVTNSGTASGTVTIPGGVLNGDVILVLVVVFTTATGSLTNALSSSVTAPVQIGSSQLATGGGVQQVGSVYSIVAGASDAGATLTFSTSGGTGGSYWYDVGLVSYTGAKTTGVPDCNAGTEFFSASSTGTTTTPSATTATAGDWQVQLLGVGAASGNASFTTPGGLTKRQEVIASANAGVQLEIGDSNASVGGSGTTIGNTTWTATGSTNSVWSTSFTVGLAPAGTSHSATASLTVTPSFSAARTRGHYRTGSLIVVPAFAAVRSAAHVRHGSLLVVPSFMAVRTGGATPATPIGSWWGLDTVFKQSRQEFEAYVSRPPMACPNCGEPLTYAPATKAGSGVERYCKYDGWQYPRDYIPPSRPVP